MVGDMEDAMSQKKSAPEDQSVPQVFDRIAETANQVGAGDATAGVADVGPIVVVKASADGSISVTLEGGRLTGLRFDEPTARRRVSTVAEDLVTLVNSALEDHELATMRALESSADGFAGMLTHLAALQESLHHAYSNDLRQLGG